MHATRRRDAKGCFVRDLLIGAALFTATTVFCLWQNSRIAVLFDLSYLLDTSWRISLGQFPYRDFPFAHAPGTFLLHALIIRILGGIYWPHIACAAIESGIATLLTWRILLRLLRPLGGRTWWIASLLVVSLVPLSIYSIYPHSIYDGDSIFFVLLALYLFVRAAAEWDGHNYDDAQPRSVHAGALSNFAAGGSIAVPLLFKQNIGIAFLGAALIAVVALALIRHRQHQSFVQQVYFLSGASVTLLLIMLTVHRAVGLGNYSYWTMTFAAERRLPSFATILGIYCQASLLWSIPAAIAGVLVLRSLKFSNKIWPRAFGLMFLAAPLLWALAALTWTSDPDDHASQLLALWPHLLVLAAILAVVQIARFLRGRTSAINALLPIFLLTTIHGAFLSQQLWGSTYALWPLLVLLIAMLLIEVRELAVPLAATIAGTLLVCGSFYAASLERLSYIHFDGIVAHATLPALRGMATPGPWLTNFEGLVRFTDAEIPANDDIVLVPGEEPFYFITGRTPHFPVLLTDLATDPYTPQQAVAEMRKRNIRWLIVKRDLQLMAPPGYETPELLHTLEEDFVLHRSLPGYDIYRRSPEANLAGHPSARSSTPPGSVN